MLYFLFIFLLHFKIYKIINHSAASSVYLPKLSFLFSMPSEFSLHFFGQLPRYCWLLLLCCYPWHLSLYKCHSQTLDVGGQVNSLTEEAPQKLWLSSLCVIFYIPSHIFSPLGNLWLQLLSTQYQLLVCMHVYFHSFIHQMRLSPACAHASSLTLICFSSSASSAAGD